MYDVIEISDLSVTELPQETIDALVASRGDQPIFHLGFKEVKNTAFALAAQSNKAVYAIIHKDHNGVLYQVYVKDGLLFCHSPYLHKTMYLTTQAIFGQEVQVVAAVPDQNAFVVMVNSRSMVGADVLEDWSMYGIPQQYRMIVKASDLSFDKVIVNSYWELGDLFDHLGLDYRQTGLLTDSQIRTLRDILVEDLDHEDRVRDTLVEWGIDFME